MEISITVNGTIKIAMTPKSAHMKHLAELIKDGETYKVSRLNNTADIIFTLESEKKENTKDENI